jgi:ComF family protein
VKKQPPFLFGSDPKRFVLPYHKIVDTALSLVFPWRCPGCGELVSYPEVVCRGCARHMRHIGFPFCKKCGAPFPVHWTVEICPECHTQKSALTQIRSLYYYENLVQKMILEVKYGRRARYLYYLSQELFSYIQTCFHPHVDAIVPVPLHRRRAWERTFNQAELMAHYLSGLLDVPVWKALQKPKKTPPQSSLSGIARRANLKGAFSCKMKGPRRVSVLLIDDVITTGATLQECARVLRKSAGVKKIYAITVARAVQQF